MTATYTDELEIALQAVHRASIVTKNVMKGIKSVDKKDASPVTMADFAAQALLISAIHDKFPSDRFVAEEAADMLRGNKSLRDKVWQLVNNANASVNGYSNKLLTPEDPEEMMRIIDLGCEEEPPTSGRAWILDPVDGTATFMKGKQYVVALSLTVDGKEKVATLGCPNLKAGEKRVEEEIIDNTGYGVLVGAVLGHGTFTAQITKDGLGERQLVKRPVKAIETCELKFTDSFGSSHAHIQSHRKVFQLLGLKEKHTDLWCMQLRYISLALGASDAMIRIPPKRSTRACVWDHSGGQLIFTEAGGKITDSNGQAFNFARGRKFTDNWGYVATDISAYDAVFASVQKAIKENLDL